MLPRPRDLPRTLTAAQSYQRPSSAAGEVSPSRRSRFLESPVSCNDTSDSVRVMAAAAHGRTPRRAHGRSWRYASMADHTFHAIAKRAARPLPSANAVTP
jgi:hypothetical protein